MTNSLKIAKHIGFDVVAFGTPMHAMSGLHMTTTTPQLVIMSEDGIDEGAYFPAQSIGIYGKDSVTALRDFCNLILEEPVKQTTTGQ